MKADGSDYYEYVFWYSNDAIVISENGEYELRENIGNYFELKEESIEPPDICLGRILCKVELENGIKSWASGYTKYSRAAVENTEGYLKEKSIKLSVKDKTSIQT